MDVSISGVSERWGFPVPVPNWVLIKCISIPSVPAVYHMEGQASILVSKEMHLLGILLSLRDTFMSHVFLHMTLHSKGMCVCLIGNVDAFFFQGEF